MATKFVHINLIAKDWRRLSEFYQNVFECVPIPPERNLSGDWLDDATGISGARIVGMHLALPGYGEDGSEGKGIDGPTLELFEYASPAEDQGITASTPGFSHIAFAVDDVEAKADEVIQQGGSALGKRTTRNIQGIGSLTFQYLADPEGNIVEIQKWNRDAG